MRKITCSALIWFFVFGGLLFFGGRIITIFPCTFTPGTLVLTISPPRGGSYLYIPGVSRLFSYFSLKLGSWALGSASPGATCFYWTESHGDWNVSSFSVPGTIIMMGTSKL